MPIGTVGKSCLYKSFIDEPQMLKDRLINIVMSQADDPMLWHPTGDSRVCALQKALRQLHSEIEGISPDECARVALKTVTN